LEPAREQRLPAICLDEQVDVVVLNRERENPERPARRSCQCRADAAKDDAVTQ
jgi:hypothetical protein